MSETIGGYEVHPAASVFPLMAGEDYRGLVASVRERGLIEKITVIGSKILDGRNRLRACLEAGVAPQFTHYEGDDPIGHVVSLNITRRHMSESQRAMVAAKVATLRHGGDRTSKGSTDPLPSEASMEEAGKLLNVSRPSVQRARKTIEKAVPEAAARVEAGELSVYAGSTLAKLPPEKQLSVLEEAGSDGRAVVGLAKAVLEADALSPRQQVARALDAKVAEIWNGGATSNAEIAKRLGCSASSVGNSLARQGLVKRSHPIQAVERKARETAEDMGSYLLSPEVYRDGSDPEQIEACIKSLRALIGASKKVINWLNNEAIGG